MNTINNGVTSGSVSSAQTPPAAAAITPRDTAATGAASDADAYTPSSEWVRLVSLVKQQPEVREDRVREVSEKLQSGAYSTADSAEQTADAMLADSVWH